MQSIRSKNTKAEVLVFRELRRRGIYFQKHYKRVIGSPDIALPSKKKAIFIDGDFWHGYRFTELRKRLPRKYWLAKIENNIVRDKKYRAALRRAGWNVLRVWEHELSLRQKTVINQIDRFLKA
jgi:DNA mismatch endonuclease (patch repair protein)